MATKFASKRPASSKILPSTKNTKKFSLRDDEEIASSDSDSGKEFSGDSEDDEIEETVQEKKIRLAKNIIEQIEQQKENELNEKSQSSAYVLRKLEEDLFNKTGRLKKELAFKYESGTIEKQLKGHKLTVTCAVISSDAKTIFSGSKDGSILKWSAETGQKLGFIRKKLPSQNKNKKKQAKISKKRIEDDNAENHGHTDEILCMALSSDFKFLASAGKDRSIKIWNPENCEFIYSFEGHRDVVSAIVFRLNSHQLFSGSYDRSVKVWNVDQLVYVETLFGHQDKILAIDSLTKERCVTCGARDRSVRCWKIVEESQLVFNAVHYDSIDCLALLNEETFFTGSNDGSLGIWSLNKKKPLFTHRNAHKKAEAPSAIAENGLKPAFESFSISSSLTGWISAVAAYHNSDMLASGSDDGFIRIWAYTQTSNHLIERFKIPINGVVNDLKFSEDGKYIVAAVGQEHKLGRWAKAKDSQNSVLLIKLNLTDELKN